MILAVQLSLTVTEAKFLAENLTATNIKIFYFIPWRHSHYNSKQI